MSFYQIDDTVSDDNWPEAFRICIDKIRSDTALLPPEETTHRVMIFVAYELKKLKKSRDRDDNRIIKILEAYKGHPWYDKSQIIPDYENLDRLLSSIEPIKKAYDWAANATLIIWIVVALSVLLAVVFAG